MQADLRGLCASTVGTSVLSATEQCLVGQHGSMPHPTDRSQAIRREDRELKRSNLCLELTNGVACSVKAYQSLLSGPDICDETPALHLHQIFTCRSRAVNLAGSLKPPSSNTSEA